MKSYKKKYQAEYQASDGKPKGKVKKKIQVAVRQDGKKEIKDGWAELMKIWEDNSK